MCVLGAAFHSTCVGLEDKFVESNLGQQTWPLCLFYLELLCCFCWCLGALRMLWVTKGRDKAEMILSEWDWKD